MSENNSRNDVLQRPIAQQPLLSIVIPTYNRNAAVVENVSRILPQLRSVAVELIVLDNCSKIPVRESLREALGEHVFDVVTVIRNAGNLGLVGNSLRAFEVGTAPYIWTLCDDDAIAPDGVSTVLNCIRQHDQCVYFWFPVLGGPAHRGPGVYDGLLAAIKAEPNLFFIALSSCAFNRRFFLERLRFGYLYTYSWAPFICPLISEIDNATNQIVVGGRSVATAGRTDAMSKWSKLDVCLGIRTLLELPMSNEARRCLRMSIDSFSFSTGRLFLDSVFLCNPERWMLFRQFIRRRYKPFSIPAGFWLVATQFGEYAPTLTRTGVNILERLVGRPLLLEVEDRFSRS